MRLPGSICSVGFSLVLIGGASGQGFVNLDFESATLVPVGNEAVQFPQAFPGWTVSILGSPIAAALYNNMFLDSAGICLIDTKGALADTVIDGLYTALLESGLAYPSNVAVASDITLSQTGLVPLGTQSLQFKAKPGFDLSGRFAVTLGGQSLSLTTLGSGTNYALYAANVSQWAGQTAQLSFTVFGEIPHVNDEGLFLDDIQFSPESVSVVPPVTLSATTAGANLKISWTPSGGTLQSSPVIGPGATWSMVGKQNPTNVPVVIGAKFFRVAP